MPVRTTAEAVKLVNRDIPADTDITAYIESASMLVDDNCLASGYEASRLEMIERWLSAHLYAVADLPTASEGIGSGALQESKAKIDVKRGFQVTVYGQQALRFDYAGNLAALDNELNVIKKNLPSSRGSRWIGYDPLENRLAGGY